MSKPRNTKRSRRTTIEITVAPAKTIDRTKLNPRERYLYEVDRLRALRKAAAVPGKPACKYCGGTGNLDSHEGIEICNMCCDEIQGEADHDWGQDLYNDYDPEDYDRAEAAREHELERERLDRDRDLE